MSKIEQLKTLGNAVAHSPKTRRWGIRAAIAFAVIGVLGFFAAPPLLKHLLLQQASEALHRPVSVESVRVNPYTLSVTLNGLRILDREGGGVLLGFESLYVNAELSSLFRAAPVVSALRVEKPQIHLVREAANRYNISDLIDEFMAKPAGPTPRFSLNNIEVNGGEIHLDDRVVGEKHVVSEIALRLPFLSSLPSFADTNVEPAFSAKVDGAPLELKGHTRPFDKSLESEFVLDLDRFDLGRFDDYLPAGLPLRLVAGSLDGDLHLTFRQRTDKPGVMEVSGTLKFSGLDVRTPGGQPYAKVQRLQIDIADGDLLERRLSLPRIQVEGLVADGVAAGKAVQIGSLSIDGTQLDLMKQTATVGVVTGKQWQAALARAEDGRLLWLPPLASSAKAREKSGDRAALAKPAANSDPALPGAGAKAVSPQTTAPATWQVSVGTINLGEALVEFTDRRTRPAAVQRVRVDAMKIEGFSTQAAQKSQVSLNAHINQKGELQAIGSFQLAPLQAELALEAKGIELLPLQPYFYDRVSVTVTRGQVAAKGTLKLQTGGDGALAGGYQGDLTIGDLASVDNANAIDFLRWKSLYVAGIDAQLAPLTVSIGEVALSDFYSRLIVTPQGKLNLTQLLRPPGAQEPEAPPPAEPAPIRPAVAEPPPSSPPIPIQIGKVTLQGGTINFTDNFIKPHYSARLTRIGGRVNGLSSVQGSTADLELRGSYDNLAPISITGKVNPLAARAFVDIKAEVRGMDMTPFSPYAAKYAGYGIERGKLSLFVTYKIENQQLQAENRLFLDQLSFGDEVAGEGGKLPVKLAVALLQNRKGEIDINLPISGSLDDPQFSLGGIIVKVILNLFVKAVTSPFALIGSIFGGSGGEDLAAMEFEAGRSSISAAGRTKLESIAKVLSERPAIKLEVEGNVDPERDREGYKQALLDRKVRRQKLNERLQKGQENDMADIQVDAKEYPDLLEKVYRAETFPKPRNLVGLVKSLPVEEMEKLIIANTQVSDDDLRDLANRRAQRVRDFLINQANVPGERVFLLPPKFEKSEGKSDAPKGSRVDFSLR